MTSQVLSTYALTILTFDFFIVDRLINLVAEDNAIEDTIYHLHRALNSGRIDLDKFLRVSTLPHFSLLDPFGDKNANGNTSGNPSAG